MTYSQYIIEDEDPQQYAPTPWPPPVHAHDVGCATPDVLPVALVVGVAVGAVLCIAGALIAMSRAAFIGRQNAADHV